MNITPQETTTQPISDDQDLAKALAGVLPDEPEAPAGEASMSDLQFEETPALPVIQLPGDETATPGVETEAGPEEVTPAPVEQAQPASPVIETAPAPAEDAAMVAPSGLDAIKNRALDELRPLINRADLPVEEKFDTYLMLIRSTDDSSLIEPAHEAAQAITDETRKAEALIDVIKEIDYLSKKSK